MAFHPARALAVNVGKQTGAISRRLGLGGGSSLPGLLAERLDPSIVPTLAGQLPNGSVLITGTNGKTTTTRIIVNAVRQAGLEPITNREGSNMLRGIATTLLGRTGVGGNLNVPETAIGIFEVDEGMLGPAVKAVQPRLVIITNLFRDQLDRYFEVDYVAHLWSKALRDLPPTTPVVLNADDPQVAFLAEGIENPVVFYGMEDMRHARETLDHVSDIRRCLRCQVNFAYDRTFYAHLGHYSCPSCGWRRPDPRVSAWKVELAGLEGSLIEMTTPWGEQSLRLPLPGLYNVYNTMAAASGAFTLGIEAGAVHAAVESATGAFGRMERFSVDGKQACIALVKNPSGYNETLRFLFSDNAPKHLMLALNDAVQDSRDVSWIWDVEFELAKGKTPAVMVSGRRADDLALRLKYAGIMASKGEPSSTEVTIESDVLRAFHQALDRMPPGEILYILPTYTAMWTLRETLARQGHLLPFWQQVAQEGAPA